MLPEIVPSPLRNCAFVLQVIEPSLTLGRLNHFFRDRQIDIQSLVMLWTGQAPFLSMATALRQGAGALVIIHCRVEKDRITRTVQLLERLPGILHITRLEAK